MDDPYHGAKADIECMLGKGADIAAQLKRRGQQDAEYSSQSRELQRIIATLAEDLADLEEVVCVVGRDPLSFGVSEEEYSKRQAFVAQVSTQLTNLRRATKPSGASSPQAETQQRHEADAEQLLMEQQQAIDMQDEELHELGHAVTRVRDMGIEIDGELDRQDKLLGKMSTTVDKVTDRLRQTNRRIDSVLDQMSSTKQYLCIAALAVILLALCIVKLT